MSRTRRRGYCAKASHHHHNFNSPRNFALRRRESLFFMSFVTDAKIIFKWSSYQIQSSGLVQPREVEVDEITLFIFRSIFASCFFCYWNFFLRGFVDRTDLWFKVKQLEFFFKLKSFDGLEFWWMDKYTSHCCQADNQNWNSACWINSS